MTTPLAVQASLAQVQARVATIEARLGATPRGAATTFDRVLSALGTSGPTAADGSSRRGPTSPSQLRSLAEEYVGIPYVWGGTDPATGLDCSGFTQHLMRRFGVELPRVSADQLRAGTPVSNLAAAQPGDLIGWDTGPRNVGADHVAVYLGNGMMAETPGRGGKVQIVPVTGEPDFIRRVLPSTSGPSSTMPISTAGLTVPSGGLGASTPFADLFASAGARHGVDPKLLALVAERESGFNPRAVSSAGAQGLMQLMPGTARGLGVADAFDPAQAIDGAARLLRGHLDTFGSVDLAVAAYNAGSGNVRRYGGVPPFAETQRYVQWIGSRYGGDGRWM